MRVSLSGLLDIYHQSEYWHCVLESKLESLRREGPACTKPWTSAGSCPCWHCECQKPSSDHYGISDMFLVWNHYSKHDCHVPCEESVLIICCPLRRASSPQMTASAICFGGKQISCSELLLPRCCCQSRDVIRIYRFRKPLLLCLPGRWQPALQHSPSQRQLAQRMPRAWRPRACPTPASWSTWTWAG